MINIRNAFVLLLFFSPLTLSDDIIKVSLMQLIVNPDMYAEKTIDVIGYVTINFEDDVIWFYKDDARVGNLANALWLLSKSGDDLKQYEKYSNSYVRIIGTYKPNIKGHMNMFPASIEISRIYTVPNR